ncbi:MAG: peptidoglycan editing factor PgeF [Lachnospiraceae bacterium]|nr:peptidoglycan editing factor PgeF [Lachnospiraceae bacterium]
MPKEEWKRKRADGENDLARREREGIPFFVFPLFERTGLVRQGFSTRIGGVSKGEFASMNFVSTRGDDPEAVRENYRRMTRALEIPAERMVLAKQTHTTNVRVVTEEDAGKGFIRERDYDEVDGLLTNVRELPLVTFYADCIPLYFLDPVKKVIGLSHAGWRGTLNRMVEVTVEKMRETYGSAPEDILAGIGPGICRDCYEVGKEVAEAFYGSWEKDACRRILFPEANGKYHLDLWEANAVCLRKAGILPEHLAVADICTCCNKDFMFSHRASGGRRGNLAAFLCLNRT